MAGVAPDKFLELEPWLAEAMVEVAVTDMNVQKANVDREDFFRRTLEGMRGA